MYRTFIRVERDAIVKIRISKCVAEFLAMLVDVSNSARTHGDCSQSKSSSRSGDQSRRNP